MKVILQQDIRGTGKKGQLIEVSDGYARNYLFPRKLAAPADNANMNEYRQKEASKAFHKQQELEAAQALAQKLEGITVKVTAKGGSAGCLARSRPRRSPSWPLPRPAARLTRKSWSWKTSRPSAPTRSRPESIPA